jgi:Ribosomal protein S2
VLRRSVGFDPDKVAQVHIPIEESRNTRNKEQEGAENQEFLAALAKKQPVVPKPDLLVILDYPNNKWAVREANMSHVPVIAICDTDCDPSLVLWSNSGPVLYPRQRRFTNGCASYRAGACTGRAGRIRSSSG